MHCIKCAREIPDGSAFCNHCGASQAAEKPPVKRSKRRRGNGEGTVYKRGNYWQIEIVLEKNPRLRQQPGTGRAIHVRDISGIAMLRL